MPAPVLATLAVLSAGAGVVHLVMVPAHIQVATVEGLAFAGAGWLQVLVAFSLWTQPTRPDLGLTVVLNQAFIGVWALSRTVGRRRGRRRLSARHRFSRSGVRGRGRPGRRRPGRRGGPRRC